MIGYQPQAVADSPPVARRRPFSLAALQRALGRWLYRDSTVFAGATLIALAAAALAVWIVVTDHRETRLQAEAALGNLANALEKDIARNIDLYDLALWQAIDALRMPGLAAAEPQLRQAALFSRIAVADYMSPILVTDPTGSVVADSDADSPNAVPRPRSLADEPAFQFLRRSVGAGLYIGEPRPDRVTGAPVIVFARRLDEPDGDFGGIVFGSVQTAYFRHLFSSLELGTAGAISLFRTDGSLLARFPFDAAQFATSIAGSEAFALMQRGDHGAGAGVSTIDGINRVFVYRRVGSLPLLVVASYGNDAVFAAWRWKTTLVLSAIAVLIGFAAMLLVALRRQLLRRAVAERRALGAADRARHSERTLAMSLARLDTVFQHSADGHFAASRRSDGRFAFDLLNRRGEELIGIRAEAMLGRTPDECPPPDAATALLSHWEACLHDGEPISYEQAVDRSGGRIHWQTFLIPVHDASGSVTRLIGTTRDITDQKQTETTLLHRNTALEHRASAAERLQLLGKLASGIAHDVNNVLQTVASCATLIERRADHPPTMHRAARMIADAADRGSSITHRLLAFSRDDAPPSERTRLAPLLADLADILRHTLRGGGHIEIRLQIDDDELTVLGEIRQLQTVLLNLATNARDAMPDGGILTLGASGITPPPPTLHPGDYARLWVEDDGTGMDAATLARVTEPFFTTKPVGEGTGLGLSLADGYAQENGGMLRIHSQPGRGTTVELWLPR